MKLVVIENQNGSNEGYYSYLDWQQVNKVVFGQPNTDCVEELWKILRIVNFGEISIPTGLVYEVLAIIKS